MYIIFVYNFKCAQMALYKILKVLRQSLGIKSHRRMMKNASYFTLKPFSILKIFKCLSCLLGHVEKRLD